MWGEVTRDTLVVLLLTGAGCAPPGGQADAPGTSYSETSTPCPPYVVRGDAEDGGVLRVGLVGGLALEYDALTLELVRLLDPGGESVLDRSNDPVWPPKQHLDGGERVLTPRFDETWVRELRDPVLELGPRVAPGLTYSLLDKEGKVVARVEEPSFLSQVTLSVCSESRLVRHWL